METGNLYFDVILRDVKKDCHLFFKIKQPITKTQSRTREISCTENLTSTNADSNSQNGFLRSVDSLDVANNKRLATIKSTATKEKLKS